MPKPPTRENPGKNAGGSLIGVGSRAPAFSLQDQSGQKHRLSHHRGRWVILYFYPKDNTSGCTQQACQFRDHHEALTARDAVVLGVSPDSTVSHQKFAERFNLPFDLLADPGAGVCTSYGVWLEKSMYGRTYMGVQRTTYLINPTGRVAHRWDKVKVPGHHDDVLSVLDRLNNGS